MRYADIIIDNRTDSTDRPYTYACEDPDVGVGSKVYVPFAKSKNLREGYVIAMRGEEEIDPKLKSRIRMIDHADQDVTLTEESVRTAVWMRDRYVCRCIDALRCFTPAGRKRVRPPAAPQELDPPTLGEPLFSAEDYGNVRQLTQEQQAAIAEINAAIDADTHSRFLLHGVTGSGKTEVYIRAARRAVEQGRTAIILVPEISLTPQTVERFSAVFGDTQIAVVHSRMTLRARYEQWQRIRSGEVRIVIGARSAVFAPVSRLGLIVIDEEHETTYKSDFTPKYDTIEVALKRLGDRDNRGVLLLGSATPSVTSSARAEEGIYRVLSMRSRYNEVALPDVTVVDMRQELKDGNRSMISRQLCQRMEQQLKDGRQIMLLQNRRGYSTFVSCRECGHVAVCPNCGVSLTYHSTEQKLVCHYCGHTEDVPSVCPECGSRYIRYFGSGTEKVEETVRELFPDVSACRIDLDSVSKKGELNRRLRAFGRGDYRILIGTQMIAKGLDFRNVGLVGIISADLPLNIPDFRSPERAFQLITQAAGRAGRGQTRGDVIIQTYDPEHYAIVYAAAQDYDGFFREELKFRSLMCYPPYSDMIQILFTSKEESAAEEGAARWYEQIRSRLGPEEAGNVFMPQQAYLSRIRDIYRYSLVIRCPRGKRKAYTEVLRGMKEEDARRRVRYTAVVDINPYSFA